MIYSAPRLFAYRTIFNKKGGGGAVKFITIKCEPKIAGALIAVMTLCVLAVGLGVIPKGVREEQAEVPGQMEAIAQKPIVEPAKIKTHTVQEGESLGVIAEKYTIDVDTLKAANDNLSTDIHQGDQLVILPSKGMLHTADMGDTLWSIANAYSVGVADIMAANSKTGEELSIGEKLFIPGGKKAQISERQLARADNPVSRSVGERFTSPAAGELTSGFGYRWGRQHSGIDIANDVGTRIRAARSGRVVYAGWYSGYGYTVMIEHDQGYTTLYGHLSEISVQNDQYIKGGQVIAYMGNTGNSTGPHLHFEVIKNGVPINPYNVLP